MKRVILNVVLGLGLAVLGARSAHAQQVGDSFSDSCASDQLFNAAYYPGTNVRIGGYNSNINRPGCPWLIVDIWNAWGLNLRWNAEWAFENPTTAAACNSAKMSYVVAKYVSGNTYTVVGLGTATGQWLNWFGSGICVWNQNSGTWSTTVNNSPNGNYRVLMRAWEPSGTERTPAARMYVNQ
jgi:hypothetical protein